MRAAGRSGGAVFVVGVVEEDQTDMCRRMVLSRKLYSRQFCIFLSKCAKANYQNLSIQLNKTDQKAKNRVVVYSISFLLYVGERTVGQMQTLRRW